MPDHQRACSPVELGAWAQLPDSVPKSGFGATIEQPFDIGGFSRRTPEPVSGVERIYSEWAALPEATREGLRIPLSRLNSALRRSSAIDQAIDLGVALEALFLESSENSELSFRLSVRAARFLRSELADRQELAQFVRRVYAVRSAAVHRGRIPEQIHGLTAHRALDRAASLAAEALRLVIARDKPDWDALLLG